MKINDLLPAVNKLQALKTKTERELSTIDKDLSSLYTVIFENLSFGDMIIDQDGVKIVFISYIEDQVSLFINEEGELLEFCYYEVDKIFQNVVSILSNGDVYKPRLISLEGTM